MPQNLDKNDKSRYSFGRNEQEMSRKQLKKSANIFAKDCSKNKSVSANSGNEREMLSIYARIDKSRYSVGAGEKQTRQGSGGNVKMSGGRRDREEAMLP